MEELIAGLQAAPPWAQVAMALFAMTFVVMLVRPGLKNQKFRRHFDELARGLNAEPRTATTWPITFATEQAERQFELRYDVRHGSSRSTYRGPTGSLLITATRLAGTRWDMHQADIAPVTGWLGRLASSNSPTGDSDFDERFRVRQDGLPPREGWLDHETRRAITQFFEDTPLPGLLWIRQGDLQFIMQDPWRGIDAPALRRLLARQAVLASALERASGWRGGLARA
jgi:hypothetical protein